MFDLFYALGDQKCNQTCVKSIGAPAWPDNFNLSGVIDQGKPNRFQTLRDTAL